MLNKPFDVLSQFTDDSGRSTLAEFVPEKGVYPAGRLDRDSEGLLLLTDDGQWQARISSPKFKMPKTYFAQVEGNLDEQALEQLRAGIELKDGPTRPAQAEKVEQPAWVWAREPAIRERKNIPTSWLKLQISEGRNRQVRRMTAAVGFPTLRLIRWSIGDWNIESIGLGEWAEQELPTLPDKPSSGKKPRPRGSVGKPPRHPRQRIKTRRG